MIGTLFTPTIKDIKRKMDTKFKEKKYLNSK